MTDCADKLGTYILFSYCGVPNGAEVMKVYKRVPYTIISTIALSHDYDAEFIPGPSFCIVYEMIFN